jgi:hypothetical protein
LKKVRICEYKEHHLGWPPILTEANSENISPKLLKLSRVHPKVFHLNTLNSTAHLNDIYHLSGKEKSKGLLTFNQSSNIYIEMFTPV